MIAAVRAITLPRLCAGLAPKAVELRSNRVRCFRRITVGEANAAPRSHAHWRVSDVAFLRIVRGYMESRCLSILLFLLSVVSSGLLRELLPSLAGADPRQALASYQFLRRSDELLDILP